MAGFLNCFLRHADVVKIANLAQIVNVIAPILTRGEQLLIQPTFYPFEMFSRRREGVSLRAAVSGPDYASRSYGRAPVVDAGAILAEDDLHVFLIHRGLAEAAPVEVELADRTIAAVGSAEILTGPDAKAANSFERPDVVRPRPLAGVKIAAGAARVELPPLSLAAITLQLS